MKVIIVIFLFVFGVFACSEKKAEKSKEDLRIEKLNKETELERRLK